MNEEWSFEREDAESWEQEMNKKLKPCPFCGWEVEMKHYELLTHNAKGKEIISIYFDIRCAGCGVRVEKVDREELVAKWNARTPEIVRCGECKYFKKKANLELVVAYNYCERYAVNRKPEDFCRCWGKRRN